MNSCDLIIDDADLFKDYVLAEADSIKYIPKFNSINIIVGANNSGKSRFMRNLMTKEGFKGVSVLNNIIFEIKDYNKNLHDLNIKIDKKIATYKFNAENTYYVGGGGSQDKRNADKMSSNRLIPLSIEELETLHSEISSNKKRLSELKEFYIEDSYISSYDKIQEDFYRSYKQIKRYYIPTLRTAHSLFEYKDNRYLKLENDIFLQTLNNYYQLKDIGVEVFTGIHLYKSILNSRNSKREIRQLFEKFEIFISNSFFNGKRIDIVAEFNKDESLNGNNHLENISVHIDGEKDTRDLAHLGDGIQAIIILMYKIFMAESNSFIFIDEPELNLHPGMQRLFLDQISTNPDLKKKNLTYIISTHSNHFLDLTIEKNNVSIYSFSPMVDSDEKKIEVKNVNIGDNQLLKHLGVNNSSVFLANSSIWVEGISDRNYLKSFLNAYVSFLNEQPNNKFVNIREDIDFAFFEYAGSNIDHYIFDEINNEEEEKLILKDINSLALNNRIFLLADSDAVKSNSAKWKRLKALENRKSENFIPKIIWNIREIENLITNDIWKEILIEYCNDNLIKNHRPEIERRITVALNEYNPTKYKKKYIGEFLNDISKHIDKIDGTYILNQSMYEVKKSGEYGTIKNKRKLGELIFEKNFTWEIFSKSKEIKLLTEQLYDFIVKK